MDFFILGQLLSPFLIFAASLLTGVLVKRKVLVNLEDLVHRTRWKSDEVILTAMNNMIVLWFTLAGLYLASLKIPLELSARTNLNKGLIALFIVSATVYASRVVVGFLKTYMSKKQGEFPATSIFINLTRITIFSLGALTLLQTLGISVTPLLTALGVGGVAVALGLKDTLASIFSGIHVLASQQIKSGDYIKLDSGEEGYVTDITWRDTIIKTLTNNTVIIPNSKMASVIITNYNTPKREMSLFVQVGVGYGSDLEKVEAVTKEVAKEVLEEIEGGVKGFEPLVRYHTFDDFSINFTVVLRINEFASQYLVKHEFIKRLYKRYQKEGIEIPLPVQNVYLKGDRK